jgi:hypothetical protein
MEKGAVGFLLKDAPAEDLAVAIRRVIAGERVVDLDLALAALSDGNNPLTSRERDVLAASLGAPILLILPHSCPSQKEPCATISRRWFKSSMHAIAWKRLG